MKSRLKQIMNLTLAFVLTLALLPVMSVPAKAATITFSGGSGTSSNPYQITTAAQLASLATEVNANNTTYNAACYKLMNNISLSGYSNWTPIGNSSSYAFSGTFDGNGKAISGLTINTGEAYAGLFGAVNNATIKNLGVEVTSVKTNRNSSTYTAGLVAYGKGSSSIINCYVTGGTIATSGTTTFDKMAAGLLAYVPSGSSCTIANCYAANKVTCTGGINYAGGLYGYGAGIVTATYSYWNSSSTTAGRGGGTALGTGCASKSATEMKAAAFVTLLNTYKNDGTIDWGFVSGKNSDYPVISAATYTVTLNGNGGNGSSLESYTYGVGAVLPI